MSRILAIVSPKDGVGRSTTAVALAQAFALGGQAALIVDLDPQRGCSAQLRVPPPRSGLLAKILTGDEGPEKIGLLVRSVDAGLDLIPADVDLAGFQAKASSLSRLEKALEELRFQYPWIVLDCPANLGSLSELALSSAHSIVIPVKAELFAKESTAAVVDLLEEIGISRGQAGPTVRIVMTMFRARNSLSADVLRDLEFEYTDRVSPTVIPRDEGVLEAQAAGRTLLQHRLECRASRAYIQLAKELMSNDRAQAR